MSTSATTADDDSPDDDGKRVVVRWLRPDGATVAADDPICEVEADDGATAEATTPEAGVLRHRVRAGATFAVGDEVFGIDPLP